ncbi:MAG: glycosyltransferase [Lachnospiraceae bacterium]|nr:glycosyltransferase [Lachnospiraceae bacterium]
MKILMINKFLHPAGGAETYVFELGACLERMGNEVQYFGMEHPNRKCSNELDLYTSPIDFHGAGRLEQLKYPFHIIYSAEAKRKLSALLKVFQPDIIHINNFNYQLTPSILEAAAAWKKEAQNRKIILTAHDYQLLCPNHLMYQPLKGVICEKCMDRHYRHCIAGKCIHGSALRSALGALESWYWHKRGIYEQFDTIICPSEFIKGILDRDEVFRGKTVAMHNFVGEYELKPYKPGNYVLYFGRYSEEKGLRELLSVCRELPEILFVFAGSGPMEDALSGIPNVKNVGFQTGEKLQKLIGEARFTVYPSVWYENCPFSVIESIIHHTPVLGADVGGIPELLQNQKMGQLFKAGDERDLKAKIKELWQNDEKIAEYRRNCSQNKFDTLLEYCEKLLQIYQ